MNNFPVPPPCGPFTFVLGPNAKRKKMFCQDRSGGPFPPINFFHIQCVLSSV